MPYEQCSTNKRVMMKQIRAVVEYTRYRVKTKSKLTNLKINSRIEGYMVNKGKIYGELRKILRYL